MILFIFSEALLLLMLLTAACMAVFALNTEPKLAGEMVVDFDVIQQAASWTDHLYSDTLISQ